MSIRTYSSVFDHHLFAYTKIVVTLPHKQIQVQSVSQGQQNQAISALNVAPYKKVVYSAVWVQITLGLCYLPFGIAVVFVCQKEGTLSGDFGNLRLL